MGYQYPSTAYGSPAARRGKFSCLHDRQRHDNKHFHGCLNSTRDQIGHDKYGGTKQIVPPKITAPCNYVNQQNRLQKLDAMGKSKSNARNYVAPEDVLTHNFGTEPVSCIHNFASMNPPATNEGLRTLMNWAARFGLARTKSGRNCPTDRAGFGLKQECLDTLRKSNNLLLPTNNVLFMFNRRHDTSNPNPFSTPTSTPTLCLLPI